MPLVNQSQKPIHKPGERPVQIPNPSRDPSQHLVHREGYVAMQQHPVVQDHGRTALQQRREQAETLKMQVPNTMTIPGPKHEMSRSTSNDSDRAPEARAPAPHVHFPEPMDDGARDQRPRQTRDVRHASRNEDPWDEPGGDDFPSEQTAVYRPLPNGSAIISQPQLEMRRFDVPSAAQHISLGDEWRLEADAGRVMRGVQPHYVTADQLGDIRVDDSLFGDANDTQEIDRYLQDLQNATPSRGDATKPRDLRNPRNNDIKSIQEQVKRFPSHKTAAPVIIQPSQPTRDPAAIPIHTVSSKVFSNHEPSSDDDRGPLPEMPAAGPAPTTNSSTKRPQHEAGLDYSPRTLKQMSFNNLSAAPFLTDPNMPHLPPALDGHGNAMTLAGKLKNLTKMAPEAQNALFQGLSDQENSQTGEWFVVRFEEDLKRLMKVRLERRKIALKFEDEVRRREVVVHKEAAGVDRELQGLKRGGGELINGRRLGSVDAKT